MSVLTRNRKGEDIETHSVEGHVKTEAGVVEIGVMHFKPRNAWDCQHPPEARERHGVGFSLRSLSRNQPCQCLDFKFLTSRTVREYIFVVLSHPICDNWLW